MGLARRKVPELKAGGSFDYFCIRKHNHSLISMKTRSRYFGNIILATQVCYDRFKIELQEVKTMRLRKQQRNAWLVEVGCVIQKGELHDKAGKHWSN